MRELRDAEPTQLTHNPPGRNPGNLKKGSLISDEQALLRQADSGKASGSTFNERKHMSTQTSIQRIALVAVSALGFGLLSVLPAKAATASYVTVLRTATPTTPAVGTAVTIPLKLMLASSNRKCC